MVEASEWVSRNLNLYLNPGNLSSGWWEPGLASFCTTPMVQFSYLCVYFSCCSVYMQTETKHNSTFQWGQTFIVHHSLNEKTFLFSFPCLPLTGSHEIRCSILTFGNHSMRKWQPCDSDNSPDSSELWRRSNRQCCGHKPLSLTRFKKYIYQISEENSMLSPHDNSCQACHLRPFCPDPRRPCFLCHDQLYSKNGCNLWALKLWKHYIDKIINHTA